MAVENTTDETIIDTPAGDEPAVETSLLDSITAALEPTIPAATDDSTETTDGDEEADGEDGDESEEDAEGDGKDVSGKPRDKDGKFLSPTDGKAKDGTVPGKDAPKLGADGKPLVEDKPGAKKADAVNDPIPDEVKGRTRERMTTLISTVKEQSEQIQIQHQLVDSISSTGATPEEFGAMLGYMRWVHSDKPEDLRQAKDLLLSELEGISLKLGEAAPGIDFLAKHKDLQDDVNNGQITVERANEIALHRTRTANDTARRTADQTRDETANAATKARNDAIGALNELGKTLNSTDPDFATKHEILKPIIASLGMLPPSQWNKAFTNAYKAITPAQVQRFKAVGEPVVTTPKNKPGNQPLRGNKTPSGGQQRQATSLLDVVNAAISEAN